MEKLRRVLDVPEVRYWDFREGCIQNNSVVAWNGEIKTFHTGERGGHSVRVLSGNGLGFVSSEKDDIVSSAKRALKIARAMDAHSSKRSFAPFKQISGEKENKCRIAAEDISFEERKDLVLKLSKERLGGVIKSVEAAVTDVIRTMHFLNSEGSDIREKLTYVFVGSSATAKKGFVETYDHRIGRLGGYELLKLLPGVVDTATEKAKSLLNAIIPKGGRFPVVCDAQLADVFIHEALGHAAEADHVIQKESILDGRMGEQIAPESVTVIDDATIEGNWGSYYFDQEGIPAQKTVLIEKGMLKGFIHSRETAAQFGSKPTGNGRSEGINFQPQVRMSNTYIKKGTYEKDELFEGIKLGFYLKGSKGGQVDPAKGTFQFSAQEGFLIEKGEITKRLRGLSLGGNTLATLNNIVRISNKYDTGLPGYCGKGGQRVPVIGNNPHILLREATVGGK